MINAINMPNEIISVKTFAMSIGCTFPLGVFQRRLFGALPPHVKPVYCVIL